MRAVLMVATAAVTIVGAILLGLYLLLVRPIDNALAPATPVNARVDMLAGKPDALILMPFVTGDVPRLVRGEALERLSRDLWFTDNADAGNMAGAVIFGMMGMPPTTGIATAFRDGVAIRDFTCLTVGCINWPTTGAEMWGLGRVKGLGRTLGPELQREQRTFTDHAAYKAAHAAVVADPLRWFSQTGAEVLQPPPDNNRVVTISLPTRLVTKPPGANQMSEDPTLKVELETLAVSLLKATGGRLESMDGLMPMPIWAMKDGQLLRSADGGLRALPDLIQHDPGLRLRVPREHVGTVRQRGAALAPSVPRKPVLEAALSRAFMAWGMDRACLPICADVSPTREFREKAEVDVSAEPFWTLDVWRVPRAATP